MKLSSLHNYAIIGLKALGIANSEPEYGHVVLMIMRVFRSASSVCMERISADQINQEKRMRFVDFSQLLSWAPLGQTYDLNLLISRFLFVSYNFIAILEY